MKKVVEKVSALTEDFAKELYYDREEIINEYSYDLGVEEGISKGTEQGRMDEKIEIAKRLIDMKMSIEEIIKVTELSQEEIDEIIDEINHE